VRYLLAFWLVALLHFATTGHTKTGAPRRGMMGEVRRGGTGAALQRWRKQKDCDGLDDCWRCALCQCHDEEAGWETGEWKRQKMCSVDPASHII